eukprot:120861-Chlamydomonas_euryale.AAC.4
MPGWPTTPNLPPFPPSWPASVAVATVEVRLLGSQLDAGLSDRTMQMWLGTGLCRILEATLDARCQIDEGGTRLEGADRMLLGMQLSERGAANSATLREIADLIDASGEEILKSSAFDWFRSFGAENVVVTLAGLPPAPSPPNGIPLDILLALGLAPPPPPTNTLPEDLLIDLGA